MAQPNGFILVGVQLEPTGRRQPFQTMLARFNSVGALDPAFGTQGIAVATGSQGCAALAQLSNGNYLVVDAQAAAEFTASGSIRDHPGNDHRQQRKHRTFHAERLSTKRRLSFWHRLFVGEESRAHNSSTEVLRFTETGVADASFANPAFHYIGTGGSGIEAIVRGVPFSRMGSLW